jgi:mono/diheme cytochrome c family protein
MSGTFGGTADFNDGNDPALTLKAAYDDTNLYILAEWTDSDLNLDRRRWLYDGPTDPLKAGESALGWTSQLNDDKIGFAFEIDAASSAFGDFATVGCAAACHDAGGGIDMRPAVGKVDIWHWKMSRSEPLGYVNDQVTDPTNGRKSDTGNSIENRQKAGADNRSGPALEWDGTTQTVVRGDGASTTLDPAYYLFNTMPFAGDAVAGDVDYQASCAGCHGANGQGATGPALNTVQFTRQSRTDLAAAMADPTHPGAAVWNGFTATEMTDVLARLRGFSGIPGYFLTNPSGSQADIITKSNVVLTQVDNITHTTYQLLMIRALQTSNADDAQFTPPMSYRFGVGLMDNDGRNHVGSRLETLDFLSP